MIETPTVIGFVGRTAERLPCLLRRFRATPWLLAADGVQPWGAGQYMGEQAIRRTQCGRLRGDLLLGDLLVPEARSPMVIARALPPGCEPVAGEQPFCLGQWLVIVQDRVAIDEGQRAAWLAALPPFLQRARRSGGSAESLFLRFMARLHEEHLLDAQGSDEGAVARAVAGAATADLSANILATNGRALFAYRGGPPLTFHEFAGITACPPCRVGEGFTRFAPITESHLRFRGVCVASEGFAAAAAWQEIPANSVLVVDRTASSRIVVG